MSVVSGKTHLLVRCKLQAAGVSNAQSIYLLTYRATYRAITLRLLGMSWGVKTTCLEAPGVSLGGSGVSIGGVGSLREI